MDSSAKEQNYWPGFVDALSNVVLTLVFVLVVFVFALVIASNKVERKAAEMIQAAHEQVASKDADTIVAELQAKLNAAQEKLKELEKKELTETSTVIEKTIDISVDDKTGLRAVGAVTISRKGGKIVIKYPNAISDLDEPSLAVLDKMLEDMRGQIVGKKITIKSYIGLESYSAARRLAYYRILGLRNHLQTRDFLKGAETINQILRPKEEQNGHVEILFD
jgi:hypothetical protein